MKEIKTIYVSVNKRDPMLQHTWVQMLERINTVLNTHSAHLVRRWVSASQEPHQSACWEVRLDVDQELCVQRLLARVGAAYNGSKFTWARADVTYVTQEEW